MTDKPEPVYIIPADILLSAYAGGFFPMSNPGDKTVGWYYSDPAAIIPLTGFNIPRTLKQFLKKSEWEVSTDKEFRSVINACSNRPDTWISDTITRSYYELHKSGHAHSVEIKENNNLIGGLYGIKLGAAFFGESMFYKKPNASKVALAVLLFHLIKAKFKLLDIQMMTSVMHQFGAEHLSRSDYLVRLKKAVNLTREFPKIKPEKIREYFADKV